MLLRIAWPNVFVMVAQAATGLIETWFVSKVGTDAIAGMALVFPGVMLMQMISAGASGGGMSSAIARALGAGRRDEAAALAMHALVINVIKVILGFVFSSVMLVFGRQIYGALGARVRAPDRRPGRKARTAIFTTCSIRSGVGGAPKLNRTGLNSVDLRHALGDCNHRPLRRGRPAGPAQELPVRDSEPGQDRINIVIGRAPDRGARLREGAKAVKSRIATLQVRQVRCTAEQAAVLSRRASRCSKVTSAPVHQCWTVDLYVPQDRTPRRFDH
jgi:hypothetical protein